MFNLPELGLSEIDIGLFWEKANLIKGRCLTEILISYLRASVLLPI
jgi:hypothetical protein